MHVERPVLAQLGNFEKIEMTHDGNCLFRAISYAVFGRQGEFLEVKNSINAFVIENWELYQSYALDADGNPFQSLSDYKHFAKTENRFGDFCDLVAASEVYQAPIFVFKNAHVEAIGLHKLGAAINLLFTGDVDKGRYDFLEKLTNKRSQVTNLALRVPEVMCTDAFGLDRMRLGAQVTVDSKCSEIPERKTTTAPLDRDQFQPIHKRNSVRTPLSVPQCCIPTENRFQILTSDSGFESGNSDDRHNPENTRSVKHKTGKRRKRKKCSKRKLETEVISLENPTTVHQEMVSLLDIKINARFRIGLGR